MLAITLPQTEVDYAKASVRHFAVEWFGETPIRLHSAELGEDGAPQLHGDFIGYLEEGLADKRNGDRHTKRIEIDTPRRRVTKAFRILRRRAPIEFDVLYCMCVLDQVGRSLKTDDWAGLEREFETSLRRTRQRLNQRSHSYAFTDEDLLVLIVSGTRKLKLWAG